MRFKRILKWIATSNDYAQRKIALRLSFLAAVSLASFSLKGFLDLYKEIDPVGSAARHVVSYFPDPLREPLASDPLLALSSTGVFIVIGIAFSIVVSIVVEGFNRTRIAPFPLARCCQPTELALKVLAKSHASPADYVTCGDVIEIARTKRLYSDLGISGWDCSGNSSQSEVTIRQKSASPYNHHRIPANEYDEQVPEENNIKYSLVETPQNFLDTETILALAVQSTDYLSVKNVQVANRSDASFALKYATVFPEMQTQANSLCLHMIVQLSDGSLLCMKRSHNTLYAKNRMSVTCEEQLSDEDMRAGATHAMSYWFKRALCEEIFPLGAVHAEQLELNWKRIMTAVSAMRVISVFHETNFINYSILGFCRLACDAEEFRALYLSLCDNTTGRDKEGIFYTLSEVEALRFVKDGNATASSLWGGGTVTFGKELPCEAHSSTLYRLVIFLTSAGLLPRTTSEILDRRMDSEAHLTKLRDELQRIQRNQ